MAQDKIMVVDNEMEIIQLIKLYLSREGYEVVWTTESTKAAELAQEEKPDLILLDVRDRTLRQDPGTKRCSDPFRQLP